MTATATRLPGYTTGTWTIDPVHSDVSFSVRHMMLSKVRGRFTRFSGEIVTAADPLASSVTAEIDLSSVDTGNEQRDDHIRSADFFEVDSHPTMTFRSTGLRPHGDDFVLSGELALHGVTRPVELALEVHGFVRDPWGGTRVGFSATGQVNRKDFGISIDLPMDGGGVVVGDKIQLSLEVEAVLAADDAGAVA
jgi:polyisoprenoid-binding protein YceI